jgi:hypothetical protein
MEMLVTNESGARKRNKDNLIATCHGEVANC